MTRTCRPEHRDLPASRCRNDAVALVGHRADPRNRSGHWRRLRRVSQWWTDRPSKLPSAACSVQ
jgi:hypothetical protein